MHYLIRFHEAGREAQPQRHKIRRDIVTTIEERIPGARTSAAAGRVFLETAGDAGAVLSDLYGVTSFSPCRRCAREELRRVVLAYAEEVLGEVRSYRLRVKCVGEARESSRALAVELGAAIAERMPEIRVDLRQPEEVIGIEVRGASCYVYHRVLPGRERRADRDAPPVGEPRFLVDQMLGHLVAWMRILGFDTTYARDEPDSELLRVVERERRILITRDGPLGEVMAANVLYVTSSAPETQLREVVEALGLKLKTSRMFTRCSLCNAPVSAVAKERLRERIPEVAYREYDDFTACRPCDKIYWKGGQYDRILDSLAGLIDGG